MRLSISQIKLFKACRRSWYFKYREGLYPVQKSDALETGTNYHTLLETLEEGGEIPQGDYSKAAAMATAYKKYIFPKFEVVAMEKELEKQIGDHVLHGFVDGLSADGYIVEHKTTSRDIAEGGEYEYNLLWDEQILAYMVLTGARKVYYTVCKKPTIRQKKDETEEEFYNRMVAWYDDDTENKIRVFTVERTDAEVEQFKQDFESIAAEIESCIQGDIKAYRNTCNCSAWGGRCEYSSICLNYDKNEQYTQFQRGEVNR